jgi:hypothetical protein
LHAAGTIDHLLKKNPQFSALKTNIRRLYGAMVRPKIRRR